LLAWRGFALVGARRAVRRGRPVAPAPAGPEADR
jgi:hypothetical protein